jgi:hypothetical protein
VCCVDKIGGKSANSEQVKKFMQPRLVRQVLPIFLDLPPGRQEFRTPGVGATAGIIVGTLHFCNVRLLVLPLRTNVSLLILSPVNWRGFFSVPQKKRPLHRFGHRKGLFRNLALREAYPKKSALSCGE